MVLGMGNIKLLTVSYLVPLTYQLLQPPSSLRGLRAGLMVLGMRAILPQIISCLAYLTQCSCTVPDC